MSPVEPALSFLIPSLRDGVQLECRIYRPHGQNGNQAAGLETCAIVAHPYGPLGGCYDDPVVLDLVQTFLGEGVTVGTFNFRGSGGSKGRASWTGKSEVNDYESFIILFLLYMSFLSQGSRVLEDPSAINDMPGLETKVLKVVVSGYSYGSLATMHLPGIEDVLYTNMNIPHTEYFSDIFSSARALALETSQVLRKEHHRASHVRVGSSDEGAHARRHHGHGPHEIIKHLSHTDRKKTPEHGETNSSALKKLKIPKMEPYYLLISPLMPPISHAVMLPLSQNHPTKPAWQDCPTLAVFGDRDGFSSIRKLAPWAKALTDKDGSHFRYVAIAGAGHFWHEQGVSAKLSGAVRDWLHTVVLADERMQ